jgi:hypothetical protein
MLSPGSVALSTFSPACPSALWVAEVYFKFTIPLTSQSPAPRAILTTFADTPLVREIALAPGIPGLKYLADITRPGTGARSRSRQLSYILIGC